ncbi:MAG: hypothetical protein EP330_00150 [Deltaproteobacteria bacterium]|nr:MAG: hypothetical protein EP330_00150 [Deltaproteobacteria bacterium]
MCRRVRLAIEDLDLVTEVRPCPRGGTRFRNEAIERSGKRQFPFLVDPNTDTAMLESADIVKYLYATYGEGRDPSHLLGPGFHLRSVVSRFQADPDYTRRKELCRSETAYLWHPGEGTRERIDA